MAFVWMALANVYQVMRFVQVSLSYSLISTYLYCEMKGKVCDETPGDLTLLIALIISLVGGIPLLLCICVTYFSSFTQFCYFSIADFE
jgi:hypothetical protein